MVLTEVWYNPKKYTFYCTSYVKLELVLGTGWKVYITSGRRLALTNYYPFSDF